MGAHGKEFSRGFTAEAMAQQYLALYRRAAGFEP